MSMPNEPGRQGAPGFRLVGPLIFLIILLAASLYAFGILGNRPGAKGGNEIAQCKAAQEKLARLKPLVKGEIAALQVPDVSKPVVPLTFKGPKGETVMLSDFKGRTILLNLWATWCVPCRQEMPALDHLQAEAGGKDFSVVAVSIDQRNLDKPKAFLDEIKVTRLGYYSDPSAKIFQDLKAAGRAFGMPTTLVIDPAGCELAYLAGPAEWAGRDALDFIRAAVK